MNAISWGFGTRKCEPKIKTVLRAGWHTYGVLGQKADVWFVNQLRIKGTPKTEYVKQPVVNKKKYVF